MHTRREFVKLAAAGLTGAAAMNTLGESANATEPKPGSNGLIRVRTTAGNKRYAEGEPLRWISSPSSPSVNEIVLAEGKTFQEVLGFGAALTDAACYNLSRLPESNRSALLKEFFAPNEMAFSVGRICIGSSDYSSRAYSYDDGDPDPTLSRFSIDHDRPYILPTLRASRAVNPELFLLASPWSPPGWMKPNGSMLGGSMRKSYFAVYADYLTRFVQQYAAEGVTVNALTTQNEVDTDQDSKMPACLWGQEYEIEFVGKHLGPKLEQVSPTTKIWILDHNYNLWGRVLCELDDPQLNRYVDGIAWHGYMGEPSMMSRVHEVHPEKHAYWTEGGAEYIDADYLTGWAKWSANFTSIFRNWARCVIAWNLVLDEKGQPNIGPFHCGGLVSVDSKTHEVTRTGQYWAFAHYSRAVRRGAHRFATHGNIEGISHIAFTNPGGSKVLILTNQGAERRVQLRKGSMSTEVTLAADSITTLGWDV